MRSLITPLAAAVVTLALFTALLAGVAGGSSSSNVITSPDTAGSVGEYSSLVLDGSGNPVVSYFGNGDLKILHCGDPSCLSGNVITSPDPAGYSTGEWTSLALDGAGNPVVSYWVSNFPNFDLRVLHCGDPYCNAGNVITSPDPATATVDGLFTSLVLDGSGNPVVSYWNFVYEGLKVLHCGDPYCGSGNVITSPDTVSTDGIFMSLVLDGSGNPVVSYFDFVYEDLKILHCGDPYCGSGNVVTSPDTLGNVGEYTSLVLDGGGNPVVSYLDATNGDLKILHCGDPYCGSGNVITSPDTLGNVGTFTSLALDGGGNPVVSYRDGTNEDLKVLHCGDPNCSSGNVITSPDTVGTVGYDASLVLDSSGNPVVSYRDLTNGDLKVLKCGDPYCSPDSDGDGVADPSDTCPNEAGSPTNGGCPFPPSIGGVVELGVVSGDSPVEHQNGGGHKREVTTLVVALAAIGVAGLYWHRYRQRVG